MKRRHVSATLLMAIALAGCGVNSTAGVATPNGTKAGYGPNAQAGGSTIEARYQALNFEIVCPDQTFTGSNVTSTDSTTTSTGLPD